MVLLRCMRLLRRRKVLLHLPASLLSLQHISHRTTYRTNLAVKMMNHKFIQKCSMITITPLSWASKSWAIARLVVSKWASLSAMTNRIQVCLISTNAPRPRVSSMCGKKGSPSTPIILNSNLSHTMKTVCYHRAILKAKSTAQYSHTDTRGKERWVSMKWRLTLLGKLKLLRMIKSYLTSWERNAPWIWWSEISWIKSQITVYYIGKKQKNWRPRLVKL